MRAQCLGSNMNFSFLLALLSGNMYCLDFNGNGQFQRQSGQKAIIFEEIRQ